MRAVNFTFLLAALAGCASPPSPAPAAAEPTASDRDADRLGSPDPSVREQAARSLAAGGNDALEACRAALERGVRDPAHERLLRSIAARLCRSRLARIWAEERFEIFENGRAIGLEVDRGSLFQSAGMQLEDESRVDWTLTAAVRTERPGQPAVVVHMAFECAEDPFLSPVRGTCALDGSGRTITFEFLDRDFVRIDVEGQRTGATSRDVSIEPHAAPIVLAANETRVLEMASLARVRTFAMRPWSPADTPAGPPVHQAVFVGAGETLWGARTLTARVYEVTTPSGVDRYEISDEFGVLRGKIGAVEIVKLPPVK